MSPQASHIFHPTYRPDIDGLRAIAVLSVVAFHAFPDFIKGGFIGVDIFFVISGFLISSIIFGSLDKGTFSFREFYARRIKRIFPALILVLSICYGFGWFVLLTDEYKQLGKHIAAGAGFVSNLILLDESGYFDNSAETKPLLHLWSLGIEEQFYIVWPFLIWFAWKGKFNILTMTILVAIISLLLNIKGIKTDSVATFYSPQTRFWELLTGSLLAWFYFYKKEACRMLSRRIDYWLNLVIYEEVKETNGQAICTLTSIMGMLILGYGFFQISKEVDFPGIWATLPVLGAILLIASGPYAVINRAVLSNKILVWFGLISFPLYLWHWPLLAFARILESEQPDENIRIVVVVIAIFLAWLTYSILEKRIRSGERSDLKVTILLSLMILVGILGYQLSANNGFVFRSVAVSNNEFEYKQHWKGWSECDVVKAPNKANGGCKVLRQDAPIDILVIGDSHAGHLASGLKYKFSHDKDNVAVMFHAACFPVYPVFLNKSSWHFECPGDLIQKALDYARSTESIKTIVLSGYPALHIQKKRFHEQTELDESGISKKLANLDKAVGYTLETLVATKKKIIFVVDNPELLKDPRSCAYRLYFKECKINLPKEFYLQRNAGFLEIIDHYRAQYPSVFFTYASDAFCDQKTCFGYKDGQLLYASRDHLTPFGSLYLINSINSL